MSWGLARQTGVLNAFYGLFWLCKAINCEYFLKYLALQLAMLLWSYFSVVLTDPGSVPPNWRPATVDEESGEAIPLTSSEFNNPILSLQQSSSLADSGNPRIRYCRKCNQLKPPRCHHCSVCKLSHLSILMLPLVLIFLEIFTPYLSWYILLNGHRWKMCTKNGSPLCVGCELCGSIKL